MPAKSSMLAVTLLLTAFFFPALFADAAASQPAPATYFDFPLTAKRIVIIVECSGSMIDPFLKVQKETVHAISALAPPQRFNVIYVAEAANPLYNDLQPSTPQVKKDFAHKSQSIRAHGHAYGDLQQFKSAFEKAFALKPDAIYFVTVGNFDPHLVNAVKKLNPKQVTPVNVVGIVFTETAAVGSMKSLTKENAGKCKLIPEKDLGQ